MSAVKEGQRRGGREEDDSRYYCHTVPVEGRLHFLCLSNHIGPHGQVNLLISQMSLVFFGFRGTPFMNSWFTLYLKRFEHFLCALVNVTKHFVKYALFNLQKGILGQF